MIFASPALRSTQRFAWKRLGLQGRINKYRQAVPNRLPDWQEVLKDSASKLASSTWPASCHPLSTCGNPIEGPTCWLLESPRIDCFCVARSSAAENFCDKWRSFGTIISDAIRFIMLPETSRTRISFRRLDDSDSVPWWRPPRNVDQTQRLTSIL